MASPRIAPPPQKQFRRTDLQAPGRSESAQRAAAGGATIEFPGPTPRRGFDPRGESGFASARPSQGLFHDALLEMSSTRPRRRTADFVLAVVFHAVVLATLLLVPLYFTEQLDLTHFTQTFLVVPPPPPPPAPEMTRVRTPPRTMFMKEGRLLAPTAIPQKVLLVKEEPLPPDLGSGSVEGGVPGGVPGGQLGGIIGGIISGRTYVPPAPSTAARRPVRVGGQVKPPRKILGNDPVYPPLARQAQIQGDVLIDAVIDTDGNVSEMRVISGHPVLIKAALEAVATWKYEPTTLNGAPVAIQLVATVHFQFR
jgi:protein TonB